LRKLSINENEASVIELSSTRNHDSRW